jgi:hypothetical protein
LDAVELIAEARFSDRETRSSRPAAQAFFGFDQT